MRGVTEESNWTVEEWSALYNVSVEPVGTRKHHVNIHHNVNLTYDIKPFMMHCN